MVKEPEGLVPCTCCKSFGRLLHSPLHPADLILDAIGHYQYLCPMCHTTFSLDEHYVPSQANEEAHKIALDMKHKQHLRRQEIVELLGGVNLTDVLKYETMQANRRSYYPL